MNKQELAYTWAIKEEWLDKLDALPGTAELVREELTDVVSSVRKRILCHGDPGDLAYDDDGHLWIGFAP